MTVTIHQVNADGAGPYTCDLDQTSNAGVISQNLTVTNNVPGVNGLSQAKTQDFNITVKMPDNLACTGASTGNVCTVRCRNNAVAGPFGGCFAVQQTDVAATSNSANTISTAQTLKAIEAQVQENNVDLPVAVAANQAAGSADGVKGFSGANGMSITISQWKHRTNKTNSPSQRLHNIQSSPRYDPLCRQCRCQRSCRIRNHNFVRKGNRNCCHQRKWQRKCKCEGQRKWKRKWKWKK